MSTSAAKKIESDEEVVESDAASMLSGDKEIESSDTPASEESRGDLGKPGDGTLGALDDLYYRRVWQWNGAWQIVAEGPVRSLSGPVCTLDGPTWCSLSPPYIYEKWWHWSVGTYGSASSSWVLVAERQNWG